MTTPPLDLPALREYAKELERDGARSGTIRTDVLRALLDRLEAAERDLAAVTVSRDGWKTRAKAAEAAIQRVREVIGPWEGRAPGYAKRIRIALDGGA